jgi:ribosomal protein S18 acetylase RimI-like enzyme
MFSESITIREVKRDEVLELQKISQQTFYNTYASQNTEEDMQNYLSENFSADALACELEIEDSYFYFAETEGKLVGYLKINKGKAQTTSKLKNAFEIERIYVVEGFKGRYIGKQLLHKTIEIAKQEEINTIWLGVWEKNTQAISFYEKNGFKAFDDHIFIIGNDPQKDILMKLEISH